MANLNIGHIKGDAGQGVPTGGTSGQFLAKNSSSDYDMSWVNPPAGAFNPFPVEKIYINSQLTSGAYYIDKNGNQTAISYSGGYFYLPAGIFDDGELHQISIDLYNPNTTGYPLILRYNGTMSVNFSKMYWHGTTSGGNMVIDFLKNNAWTPTANIFNYVNTYASDKGFIWVQKVS